MYGPVVIHYFSYKVHTFMFFVVFFFGTCVDQLTIHNRADIVKNAIFALNTEHAHNT